MTGLHGPVKAQPLLFFLGYCYGPLTFLSTYEDVEENLFQ